MRRKKDVFDPFWDRCDTSGTPEKLSSFEDYLAVGYPAVITTIEQVGSRTGGRGGGDNGEGRSDGDDSLTLYTEATGGGLKPKPRQKGGSRKAGSAVVDALAAAEDEVALTTYTSADGRPVRRQWPVTSASGLGLQAAVSALTPVRRRRAPDSRTEPKRATGLLGRRTPRRARTPTTRTFTTTLTSSTRPPSSLRRAPETSGSAGSAATTPASTRNGTSGSTSTLPLATRSSQGKWTSAPTAELRSSPTARPAVGVALHRTVGLGSLRTRPRRSRDRRRG